MEKLSQYEIQPIRCENKVGLIWDLDKLSISVAILKLKIFIKTFIFAGLSPIWLFSAQYQGQYEYS